MADKSLSTIAQELWQGFGRNPRNTETFEALANVNPIMAAYRGAKTLSNVDLNALKQAYLNEAYGRNDPTVNREAGRQLGNIAMGSLDVLPVVPVAKAGLRAAAPSIARQAVNLAEKYGVSPVMNVVKPEGPSNWMPGSVELTTDRLKERPKYFEEITGDMLTSRNLLPIWEEMHTTKHSAILPSEQAAFVAKYYPEKLRDFGLMYTPQDQAVNTFIDKRLKKYIRNEMGTESDPVRALAERGVLHFNPDPVAEYSPNVVKNQVALRRSAAGFPAGGSAESELARNWENLSDFTIEGNPVSKWKEEAKPEVLATMPWIEHLGPADVIWERTDPGMRSRLGLDHLVDELKNAVDPDSTLPQHLRLSNKQLEQMPMERAVEHVSKINDWRAAEAARAEQEGLKANLSASARLEDTSFNPSFAKGQGGKWVDVPETVDENGMQLCTSIGKAGGWCTQTKGMAKQEGSGENRLAVLLDVEGRPHVQATVNSINVPENATGVNEVLFNRLVNEGHDPAEASQIVSRINDQDYEVFDYYNDRGIDLEQYVNDAEAAVQSKNTGKQQLPSITQLKPVGNSISSTQAREYARRDPEYQSKVQQSVVNFLNSREWGNVKNDDLRHLGIVDLNVAGQADSLPGIDSEALYLAFHNAPADTPRFMTDKQFKDFVAPYLDTGAAFAAGGLVDYNEDDIDKMSDNLMRFDEGGLVEKTARLIRKGQYGLAKVAGIGPEVEFATEIPERYYPANEQHNARGDAMRHILLQAQLANRSPMLAKAVGWAHENLSGPQGPGEKEMDLYNDRIGREIGMKAKDKADMVWQALQAIDNRKIKTLTKEQMDQEYAEGGLVYNDDEISKLADQLIGV